MKLKRLTAATFFALTLALVQADAGEGHAKSGKHASRAKQATGMGDCISCDGAHARKESKISGDDFGGNPTRSSATAYENTDQEAKYRDGNRVDRTVVGERPYGERYEQMEAEEEDSSMMDSESEMEMESGSDWDMPKSESSDSNQ